MDIFQPIQTFADIVTYDIFSTDLNSYLGKTVNFFIYDVIKIGLLLLVINFFMAMVRYYFPVEKTRTLLTKRRWFGFDYLFAAVLGVITPFCSCSSIPLFIGFVTAGIPLGVTFAFLISSPLVNEASLYLFPAMFGFRFTLLYNFLGILVAMLGGMLIQRLKMEKYILPDLLNFNSSASFELEIEKLSKKELLRFFWFDGFAITKKIFPYMVLGVALGALIHGFVPTSFVEEKLSSTSWLSVPLAVLLGAPLYANSIGVIPIMEALVYKGVPVGTILAFMTAIVTVSIPEALILKNVMHWKLLALFFGITLAGIVMMGYVFNFVYS
jgi:uncharacterized membrane protein YraQ (UPF0718 family)